MTDQPLQRLSDEDLQRLRDSLTVLTPKAVVVVHPSASDDLTWNDVWGNLAQRLGVAVILLSDGQRIETLDEAQMREHGWVRERTWKPEEIS